MATITLKGVPEPLHRSLKQRAREHGRSLNREVLAVLEGSFHSEAIDGQAIRERARAVRESLGVYVTRQDLKELKDSGRR